MKLQLITLRGLKMDDDVYEVMLPTAEGEIAVYPGHEPLVTLAVPGIIRVRRKKNDLNEALEYFATNGGVAEIDTTGLRILVDEAESSDDLVTAEVEAALKRAEEQKSSAKDQVELDKAQALIDRHAVRLKVAGLRRHKQR
jgi:F-type H+-transporting ATPase subunit epsilon